MSIVMVNKLKGVPSREPPAERPLPFALVILVYGDRGFVGDHCRRRCSCHEFTS
jgi:hypothetical protein